MADLPDGLVEGLYLVRDLGDALNGSVGRNQLVFHVVVPEVEFRQVPQQMVVDDLELSREHSTRVNVARVGLNTFVVTCNIQLAF